MIFMNNSFVGHDNYVAFSAPNLNNGIEKLNKNYGNIFQYAL